MSTFPSPKTEARLRPSPWDALVIAAVLAAAAALVFLLLPKSSPADALVCTVSQDGQVLDTVDITVGMADQARTYGEYVVEFNHGNIRVTSAPCANQDCVRTGWISRGGQSIVCLPGRFVVELSAAEAADQPFDVVVG